MARTEKKLLGASLIQASLITERQLEDALKEQRRTGQSLGYTLIERGYISQNALITFLETKLGIPYANLANYVIDPEIVKSVPEDIAVRYQLIPLLRVKNTLTVAMLDPLDSFVIDSLKYTTGCEIKPLIATRDEIIKAQGKYYASAGEASHVTSDGEVELNELQQLANRLQGVDGSKIPADVTQNESPVIKLVNLIIVKAIQEGASDIHIEPDETVLRTRYRVDGVLHEVMSLSKTLEAAVISRIKVMADMDIAEKRVPQDGRAEMKVCEKKIDLRISTFPTINGEKVVLRILDKSSVLIPLEDLGFTSDVLDKFKQVIKRPNGIILVTGPTGSGKTTTLYAALDKINTLDKNIVTIEDPVEYQLKVINQSQVNPKAGFTFASGLRSILRQDPDIVMVGEIRDYETGEIAIRAALTGHLVLSTLHTNDAPGAITRLIDMNVEPFLVSSSVICVMGQRLVRCICPDCKVSFRPSKQFIGKLRAMVEVDIPDDFELYRGSGCSKCKNTGFRGRTTINELMIPNDVIHDLIVNKASSGDIKREARRIGMRTLREDGILKVLEGITTIEEVVRVAQVDD